jgi:hypothetical protein
MRTPQTLLRQAFALFVPDLRRTTGCLLTQLADLRVTLVCVVFWQRESWVAEASIVN